MRCIDHLAAVQIRDGAGHLHQPIPRAGGQAHPLKRALHHGGGSIGQRAQLFQIARRNLRVADDPASAEPFLLNTAGSGPEMRARYCCAALGEQVQARSGCP